MDFIWVVHESLPDAAPVQVTEESFDLVWSLRGFVECDPPTEPDPEAAAEEAAMAAVREQNAADEKAAARKARRTAPTPAAPSGIEKE